MSIRSESGFDKGLIRGWINVLEWDFFFWCLCFAFVLFFCVYFLCFSYCFCMCFHFCCFFLLFFFCFFCFCFVFFKFRFGLFFLFCFLLLFDAITAFTTPNEVLLSKTCILSPKKQKGPLRTATVDWCCFFSRFGVECFFCFFGCFFLFLCRFWLFFFCVVCFVLFFFVCLCFLFFLI